MDMRASPVCVGLESPSSSFPVRIYTRPNPVPRNKTLGQTVDVAFASSSRLLLSQFRPPRLLCCSSNTDSSSSFLPDNGDNVDDLSSPSISVDGVHIELKTLGNNRRRIRSTVAIDAPLHVVWNILTDYERLADFIPGLAVSQLLDKGHNYARLYQIGQQNLAFGMKFNAKVIVDCYEKELESLPFGQKRDIEFKMIQGDFQIFEGKWSIEQFNRGTEDDSWIDQEIHTTLSYFVDVKPELWLPVRLVEGRLCKEIKLNLACIREEAQKAICKTPRTL
ncbi:hypothetical protein FNV43_RR23720 [Rhamnella rubrinervis]|uniref:Coenzyme Q-binding protein COQ10 START domain-containing protein n=1 Tax=Rhamnella rubrinervis TaxID=2594499 RepID=A0A8K0DWN6_9ROSA|nr:hypothetical protein FNV43_RR23720 [Rhamnella rubrinervis]